MMSKKHYVALAKIFALRRQLVFNAGGTSDPYRQGAVAATNALVYEAADYFASDNPRFDRDRFLADCGLGEGKGA